MKADSNQSGVVRSPHVLTGGETIVPSPVVLDDRGGAAGRSRSRVNKSFHTTEETGQKVKIDYLSISVRLVFRRIHAYFGVLLPDVRISPKTTGWNGYPLSATLNYRGVQVGLLAWGAKHARNFISFSGNGCARVKHWNVFYGVLDHVDARITRIDLAFDIYKGEVTYADCEAAAFPDDPESAGGEFVNPRGGPRKLVFKRHASGGAGGNMGRSLYIGSGSKRICMYEKGLEVMGKLPSIWEKAKASSATPIFDTDHYGCPGGTEVRKWLRLEVRYTSADRQLDRSMLLEPERYFAGAYPFCARVIARSDGLAPTTLMTNPEATLEKLIYYGRIAYGPVLHVLHSMTHLTKEEVFDKMVSQKISPKLRSAGVFLDPMRVFTPGEKPQLRNSAATLHTEAQKAPSEGSK